MSKYRVKILFTTEMGAEWEVEAKDEETAKTMTYNAFYMGETPECRQVSNDEPYEANVTDIVVEAKEEAA
jgi:hypothetical protein